MHTVKLYGRFLIVYMRSQLEYRFSFFGDVFVNMLTFVSLYLGFWVLFQTFPSMDGWGFWEVLFLNNLNLMTYATCSMFLWGPMIQLENTVRTGEFDNFLVRPYPPLLILVFRQFGHTFIGHLIVSSCVLALCTYQLSIQWTVGNALFLLFCLIGGILIQGAIMIAAASSAFWVIRSKAVLEMSIYTVRSFINYPISIYVQSIQLLLTFLIPYAIVNYYPASLFFGKEERSALFYFFPVISVAVGALLFLLACKIFSRGVARYDSSGS
ncbi:hypothetical protein B1A99_31960 [Cohnella sp. CIP 111063]|uniref:ABC transporter permease n=1 Tax=unclassified Cohnella TaxID=2636738 RepID=UPI000B8BDAF4|nr:MULTISPECIES: ABC-2 family transporter protein [unclassified Cohnella]OXS52968.1 hypothetical protein B1A99_31960 [Cohnella sp. CIP 111063]PRX60225.1 ABC-2 type transport system permease protein [Cohnella sp. SGD-V74]